MKKKNSSIFSILTRYDLLGFGIFVILLANAPLFTTRVKVNWDAFGEMWEYFRWIGSSLREGYFPDFFPNILLGYPIGANIQAGVYNILYIVAAYTFPDSVLSINYVYIITQATIFYFLSRIWGWAHLWFRFGMCFLSGSCLNCIWFHHWTR